MPLLNQNLIFLKHKNEGTTFGWFVKIADEAGGQYLIKKGKKNTENFNVWQPDEEEANSIMIEYADQISEYLFAPLYQEVLSNYTPEVELFCYNSGQYPDCLDGRHNNGEYIFIGSKLFDNYQDLNQLSATDTKGLSGLLKVLMASVFLGEADIQINNIGVVTTINKETQEKIMHAVKIDHGRSGRKFHSDVAKLYIDIVDHVIDLRQYIQLNSLSAQDMLVAIDQCLSTSLDSMHGLLISRTNELAEAGVVINERYYMEHLIRINNIPLLNDPYSIKNTDHVDLMFKEYTKLLSNQRLLFQELRAEIVRRQEQNPESTTILCNMHADYILAEVQKDSEIFGVRAIEYALAYDIKLANKDPILYAIENNIFFDCARPRGGPKISAIVHGIAIKACINGQSVAEWAIRNNKLIEGIEPLQWCSKKGILIEQLPVLFWATEKKIATNAQNAIL